jgi:hypothetical protein
MKKFVLVALLIMAAFVVGNAKPGSGNFGSQISAAKCDPSSGKLVLNVVYQVSNDVDSGFHGNWAMDSYMKHVQAWDMGNGTFCLDVKYTGSFVTIGGLSPQEGNPLAAGVTGTMDGGYTATLTGVSGFNPSNLRTKGNIGSKDYECPNTATDPSQCPGYYSFLSTYFTGGTFSYSFWGWTYRAGSNGTWVNADSSVGSSGDITGTP